VWFCFGIGLCPRPKLPLLSVARMGHPAFGYTEIPSEVSVPKMIGGLAERFKAAVYETVSPASAGFAGSNPAPYRREPLSIVVPVLRPEAKSTAST
jgi:hypothetical protein